MSIDMFLYLSTMVITHHCVSFIQISGHRLIGHQQLGGFLQKIHAYEHHGIDSRTLMVSDNYLDEAKSADYFYAVPALIMAFCVYRLLPPDIFYVHVIALGLSTFAHFYLHVQYHLKDPWLKRFGWFQIKQRLHLVHHIDMTKNFAVIEFFWDRILGTYQGGAFPVRR